MAKKKSSTEGATKTARKGAVKKKSGAAAQTAAKSGTPKAKKAAAPKATKTAGAVKKKKAGAVKLNERQTELLKKVHGAGASGGYHQSQKAEERTLEALRERKLVKKGAKDKAKGTHPYHVTKAGEKHLSTAGGAGGASSGGAM